MELILRGKNGGATIDDIAFTGAACAICLASASMMTEHVKGLSTCETRRTAEDFRRMLVGGGGGEEALADSPLLALAGVRKFPMRVKCATLPWHTLLAALDSGDAAAPAGIERTPVSTE